MKTSRYFDYTRNRPNRKWIKDEWILSAVKDPVQERVQGDGRIRRWTWVKEDGKFLRVILLDDGETIHNAFFDRDFKMDTRP